MISFPLAPERGARLLLQAYKNVRHLRKSRETALHVTADKHVALIQKVVQAAFDAGRKVGAKSAPSTVKKALIESLPPILLAALEDCGNTALDMLPQRRAAKEPSKRSFVKLKMRFDASNPDAADWAREHALELADDISETSAERIKEAIAIEQETGEDAYDEILDAIGDESRAEMIARTEAMDAANEGLAQGWSQAVEEGLLTGDEKKVWIAAGDPCPECEEVDGEEVLMDEDFSVGDDPPLHPNCRCTMGLTS
ncbi:MAG: phage minor head protein [Gemmatimonadota bacterium]